MTYPDGIDALVNVNATDSLAAGGHAARHNSVNTALDEVRDLLNGGDAGEVLTAAGSAAPPVWAAPSANGYVYNSTVYFTSNGTFAKADYPWLRAIRVKVQGAGGGGGGCATTGANQNSIGSGGGGGAYAEKFITDIPGLSASVTVTVGSGGAGGAAGTNNGSTGGQSSFGAVVTADGGGGGVGQAALTPPIARGGGGGGVTTSGGDLAIEGSGAGAAFHVEAGFAVPSQGGIAFLSGRPTSGTVTGVAGATGKNYGGGGNGGTNSQNQGTARAGGAGAAGIVIVELFA
jgi:hypothetical protein